MTHELDDLMPDFDDEDVKSRHSHSPAAPRMPLRAGWSALIDNLYNSAYPPVDGGL